MHFLKLALLPLLMLTLPLAAAAGGHIGGHGGHGHSGGHVHCGRRGHVSLHYTPHCYRSRGSYYTGSTDDNIPLKGVHELGASAGVLSGWQVTDNGTLHDATPAYSFAYRYYVSSHLAIGISGGVQTLWGTDTSGYEAGKATPYNFTQTDITIAADAKWVYHSGNFCQAYGAAAIGVTQYTEQDHYQNQPDASYTGYKLNGQITPIGIRVGRAFGVYAELGYGYKGILNMGLSYEFNYGRASGRW